VPYLSASAVVIHYKEALYQVYGPLAYWCQTYSNQWISDVLIIIVPGRRPRTILFILPVYSHFLPLFLHFSKEWRCGSLSVFNGHLPGEPGLACVHWSKKIMEVLVTTGAISRAKLQWNHHHKQTNIQFLTGRMPFLSPNQQCQSTEGISAYQSRFRGI